MKKSVFIFTLLLLLLPGFLISKDEPSNEPQEIDNSIIIDRISNDDVQVHIPSPVFSFTEAEIRIKFNNPEHTKLLLNKNKVEFIVNGQNIELEFVNGEASFKHSFKDSRNLSIYVEDLSYSNYVTVYPLWAILIPVAVIVLYLLKLVISRK
ncbi:MAG TPA: hypothetical protein VF868_12960 [Bacteroidia bacterium]|jgi:hypothetical protein